MILRPSHRLGPTITSAVLAVMLALGPPLAAHAAPAGPAVGAGAGGLVTRHNELLGTDPPDGARLATGPARVVLTFDLPAQRGLSTVIVTGPDSHQWQADRATEAGATVVAPLRPLGPAGDYTVAWRIVSADGHPVRGTFQFTLTIPGPGKPAVPRPDAAGTPPAAQSHGTLSWLWLAGAGVLLVVGMVLAVRARRTRRP
ncbi:MAG TPA: copper resistance CopC family protein [Pseudonocardiaceae bacterium]|nr:copper resistance CopC family protein [Pseudonocardiaceae bacterium]